jgi:TatD DNase family protein
MFDSHIHLDFPEIAENLGTLLREAKEASVTTFLVPGCHQDQWSELFRLLESSSETEAEIYFGVGQHPYWSEGIADIDALCAQIAEECTKLGAVCIGECGLDRGRGAPPEKQAMLLEAQLRLANERDLPVVLHQVGEQELFLRCFKRAGVPRAGGVVHGFSGAVDWGQALMKKGFHLGLGLSLLREGRTRLRMAAGELSLDRLLLETDAPDQKAQAGLPGRPADLALVSAKLAEIRGEERALIEEVCERNARELFRVEKAERVFGPAEAVEPDLAAFANRSPGGIFLP